MIFEEFFLKKKIDLAQLKDADPSLFEQFKSHYSLMGEKSFDHTKKYWFNKLRHVYPLSAEEEARLKEQFKGDKNVPKSEAVVETPGTEIVAAKPSEFRPKFKTPTSIVEVSEENKTEEIKASDTQTQKPAGFKPRFNAAAIAKKPEVSTEEGIKIPETPQEETKQTESAKPTGFKPRFKAGTTKTVQEENISSQTEEIAEKTDTVSKPTGFSPRFKAGVTKTVLTESTSAEIPNEIKAEEQNTQEATDTAPAKPLGFKPRFKAGVTQTVQQQATTPQTSPEVKEENSTEENKPAEASATATTKPLGFKPRFKAGTTTVVKEQNTEPSTEPESVKEEAKTEITEEVPSATEENKPEIPAANKPLGFKPRFKPDKKD